MAITKIKTETHEEWLELRSKYLGGSDAASVVGLNPFCSAYTLWAEKTNRKPPFEGNLATEVGSYLEDFVAKKFEQETGKKVRRVNQSLINDDYPWAIANIDRDIIGEDAGLEIKTTSELNTKKFKNGEYPANYYCQCMHYLAVTGKKRWYLAVLIGNREFKTFTIERDEEEIAALMSAEKDFWELVTKDIAPTADGLESTTKTLTALYPNSNAENVNLYGYEDELNQYMAVSAQIKSLEAIKDEIANKVKSFLGESGKGENEHYRVSWTSSERKTLDSKKLVSEHPEIDMNEYYKITTSRTFRVTEKGDK